MKSITSVTCGLIGVLILAGCSRKSPQAVPAAPGVLVIEAATRDVPVDREWIGTIDGSENADIRARVTGHLIKRNYNEGSLVKKGDVLFEIDPRPFEAALSQAKSELEEGKAAALAAAADRARADKLLGKEVISAQEHTNKTQLHEANEAMETASHGIRATMAGCQLVAFVCLTLVFAGCKKPAPAAPEKTLVRTTEVESMENVRPDGEASYLAIIRAEKETDLSFKVAGILETIGPAPGTDWDEGTPVKAGAVLAELKQADFINALNSESSFRSVQPAKGA